jgi:glycosyltransferase involved in cell wall biosynthesis
MKVSIIIPVYNQAEFLEEAIRSALDQNVTRGIGYLSNLEIIIVDDGSTDNSLEIAHEYEDTWLDVIVKIVRQSNKGLAGARNAGVMNSSGEALVMLDADDWIDPDFLEKTVPLMTEGIGIVTTAIAAFGIKNEIWSVPEPVDLEHVKVRNRITGCCLVRREAFLQTGGYNPRMVYGYEDWNLWIDILKRGWKVAVLQEPLFHYRVKEKSMMTEMLQYHHGEMVNQINKNHPELYGK